MDTLTFNNLKDYCKEISLLNPNVVEAYLFGSFATNKQRKYSDIDIAFIIDNLSEEEKFETQVNLLVLASKYDTRIEPHPISYTDFYSNNPFANEIKQNGIKFFLS